ncbi:PASTA domain-containing protein [Demequina sp.]|uniref:PASTA domain-containing protein n=1 Tax=Demequina sp. TaxID=2050685 RepID=UPI0025C4F06E|nr:PASTA domain-containing protein [Demequina sp.]
MPDVAGKALDVAKSDINDAGFTGDVEVLGGGLFGIVVESNWQVCDQSPAAGATVTGTPELTVDRTCGDEAEAGDDVPSVEPSPTPEAAPYVYEGPGYEIITVDEDAGFSVLDQYWVLTDKLDYSTNAYKDQVKLIIADVARQAGTASVIVQVVTDAEIAAARSNTTIADFTSSHDMAYFNDVIDPKLLSDWVAWYQGGYDSDTGELSDSANAFGIDWWIAGDSESEKWKPEIAG